MSIQQAAQRGVQVYRLALQRHMHEDEAYIRGLDFIIDRIYHDANISKVTEQAIRLYERQVGK